MNKLQMIRKRRTTKKKKPSCAMQRTSPLRLKMFKYPSSATLANCPFHHVRKRKPKQKKKKKSVCYNVFRRVESQSVDYPCVCTDLDCLSFRLQVENSNVSTSKGSQNVVSSNAQSSDRMPEKKQALEQS
jgi:hypothetical protein